MERVKGDGSARYQLSQAKKDSHMGNKFVGNGASKSQTKPTLKGKGGKRGC